MNAPVISCSPKIKRKNKIISYGFIHFTVNLKKKKYKLTTVYYLLPVEESYHPPFVSLSTVLFHDVWVLDQFQPG